MLASLNDPRIATLYGLEEYEGQRFLVMELVPGRRSPSACAAARCRSRRARHLPADRRRPRGRARRRHHPSRPEAGQRQSDSRRPGEAAGLWPREGARNVRRLGEPTAGTDATREGADPGDTRLHEPRAGAWSARGPAHRHLGVRLLPLRNAVRAAAFNGTRSATRWSRSSTGSPDWGALPDHVPARVPPAAATMSDQGRATTAPAHRRRAARPGGEGS